MKRRMTAPGAVALGVTAALVISGCTANGDQPGGEARTTLTVSHPQEPTSWNYLEDASTALLVPSYLNVMESLFETTADSTLEPLLAESYEISDDGLTYTIELREAVFHDGSEFDSADVLYSLEKNATSANGAVASGLSLISSAEAPDERTVVITLDAPSNAFTSSLGTAATMIAPEGWFESDAVGTTLVGTGPFSFGEYRRDVDLTLERFPDYWGELPYLETVVHRFMTDETATINAFRAGELDVIGMLLGDGVDQVSTLAEDPAYSVTFTPATQSSYVFLNPETELLQDERVRQAIAHAFDREPILTAAVGGYAEPTCLYLVPYLVPWNTDYCPYPYDPEASRELLAEAGHADGITLDFPYLTIAEFPASFEVMSAQLAEAGITVEGRGQDLATWLDQTFSQGDYEIAHITNNASLFALSCSAGLAPLGLAGKEECDPEFESYVVENDKITDYDAYVAAMKQMVNRLTDEAWVIPIFGKTEPTIALAQIEGIAPYRTNLEMDYRHITWAD